ncbi:O-antigen ligase family protein [Patescibacteria group bacterium]|nr:O-antigen ligase family protein [Patescibacteria group bacterium]
MLFILLIPFAFLVCFKPKYALWLILILIPTYQIKGIIYNIPVTFLELMILILVLIYCLKNIKRIKELIQNLKDWQWPILIWLIIATLAIFISPDLRAGAGVWKAYFIEPILLLVIFLDLIKNKRDLKLILSAFIFSALTVSIYALYQKFVSQGIWSTEVWGQPQILRITSFFPHPNFLGLYLGPLIILGLGQIFSFKNRKILVSSSILFFGICFLSLIFARSEAAILAVLIGLLFIGLIIKSSQKYTLGILAIILLLVFIFPVSRNYFFQKVGLQDLSGQLRFNIWQGAVDLIKEKPILGAGLDGYERLAFDYQKRFYDPHTGELISVETHPYPHNLYLTLWLELGLLGLIVFIWMLIKFFKQGFKQLDKKNVIISTSIMAAMIVIIIHGLADTPYFKNDLSVLFWLIIGLEIVLNRKLLCSESK